MSAEYIYPTPKSLPAGSPVIAYCRDSGGTNQGESIDQQERVIRKYCDDNGLVLMRVYTETQSGRKTKNRKIFLGMIEDVMTAPKERRPRGLLVWSISRFARNLTQASRHFYTLLDEGLIVHSLTEHFPEGIAGSLLFTVAAYTHEKYSEDLGKNIKRAAAERVKNGFCNGGQAPMGYKVKRSVIGIRRNGQERLGVKWEADEELAPLVRLAWELRAQGKGYAAIIKATKGKLYTNKGSWITHFQNKSYLGIGKAGGLEVPDHHEPLITWELWDAVRKVEKERDSQFHHNRISHPSLLAGFAKCVYCNSAMVLHTARDYRCYVCGKRDRQRGYKDCTEARKVNAPKAERIILDAIRRRIISPEFAASWVADIQEQMTNAIDFDKEIGRHTNALMNVERSMMRLLDLAERTGELEEIENRLVNHKREKTELEVKIKTLKARRDSEIPQITAEALALVFSEIRAQLDAALESGDIPTAKKIISQFVDKIELSNKAAIIYYVCPQTIQPMEGMLLAPTR